MKHAKQIVGIAFAGLLASAAGSAEPGRGVSVDAIPQKNLAAIRGEGGTASLSTMDAILQISEAGYTLLARYRAATDGAMRIDVFSAGERVYSEGVDELGAWEWPGAAAEPQVVVHDGASALLRPALLVEQQLAPD